MNVEYDKGKYLKAGNFSGNANLKEDAQQNAEIKYLVWKKEQRKLGNNILEVERSYNFRQLNEVHWKCQLEIKYKLTEKN